MKLSDKVEFNFKVKVKIPSDELRGFMYAFYNKKFDLFRYLSDNQAKIEQLKTDELNIKKVVESE